MRSHPAISRESCQISVPALADLPNSSTRFHRSCHRQGSSKTSSPARARFLGAEAHGPCWVGFRLAGGRGSSRKWMLVTLQPRMAKVEGIFAGAAASTEDGASDLIPTLFESRLGPADVPGWLA